MVIQGSERKLWGRVMESNWEGLRFCGQQSYLLTHTISIFCKAKIDIERE